MFKLYPKLHSLVCWHGSLMLALFVIIRAIPMQYCAGVTFCLQVLVSVLRAVLSHFMFLCQTTVPLCGGGHPPTAQKFWTSTACLTLPRRLCLHTSSTPTAVPVSVQRPVELGAIACTPQICIWIITTRGYLPAEFKTPGEISSIFTLESILLDLLVSYTYYT